MPWLPWRNERRFWTPAGLLIAPVGLLLSIAIQAAADGPVLVATDTDRAAWRVAAPVSVEIDMATIFHGAANPDRLRLRELNVQPAQTGSLLPVQFVPLSKDSSKGKLWWLMPPGAKGQRRFQLVLVGQPIESRIQVSFDRKKRAIDVSEAGLPVLRYNHGTVWPPPEIVEHFEKNQKPPLYYARGDYIHPVNGPDGQTLTDDYSMNHPHHRGICWAWPVVRWRGEARDLWAVRVLPTQPGGVWARPVSINRALSGPVLALVEAENVWMWADQDPIVQEFVSIRAFGRRDRCRFVDIEIRLVALVDDLSIGGRPKAGYGGFTFRTFPEFEQRKIRMRIDPPTASPRMAWFHLTGNFPGGRGPAGVLLLEHVSNPGYPSYPDPQTSDAVVGKYPKWRTVQPAWPGDREVDLGKGIPLVLKYRLWIHPGLSDDQVLSDVWFTHSHPVSTSLEE